MKLTLSAAIFAFIPWLANASDRPYCPAPISYALYEFGYIYQTTGDTGIDKDVANELSRRSACRFEFTVKPRSRIWHDLETGALMMSGSAIPTATREKFAWFIITMSEKNYAIIDKSSASQTAEQFAANSALRLGAVRSFRHGTMPDVFIDLLRRQGRVAEEPDLKNLFRILSLKRTSAVFATPTAYAKYIDEFGLAAQVEIKDWFPKDPPFVAGLVFSKKHFSSSEIEKWRAIVRKMRADGTLKAIYTKHLGVENADLLLRNTSE